MKMLTSNITRSGNGEEEFSGKKVEDESCSLSGHHGTSSNEAVDSSQGLAQLASLLAQNLFLCFPTLALRLRMGGNLALLG